MSAVFSVNGIAELDEVGVAADGLRIGPLQAVGVGSAFRAARASVAMGGAVVGHRRGGEVVPPVARGALGEEGVCVGEEGGVGKGFL